MSFKGVQYNAFIYMYALLNDYHNQINDLFITSHSYVYVCVYGENTENLLF